MSNTSRPTTSTKTKSQIASKIPTSGRDSGTHSRSSSVSNLTAASDIHSEVGDVADGVKDLKIGDRVYVNGTKPGYLSFLGKTEFAPGVWAGVILDDPVGKNNGSVAGIQYFSCEPLKGIFARPGKLTKRVREGSVTSIGNSSIIGIVTPKSSHIPSSRTSTSSVSSVSPKYVKLKVGDRITVSSLTGIKNGTLKFVGETEFAKGEWAGIELDEPSGKNDGSVAGKRYFQCEMKYGLFAPLHKVSRPGMTTPVSVRSTHLMRSSSKDSLCSSVSTCSRASRVKLGVTSLTASAQKTKTPGGGITTATKAIQEALKEKEQHIEELLKERDLDRTEFARLTSQLEENDTKYSELQKELKTTEGAKKSLEDKLTTVQRKLEDIQFQLEEEKIMKSDFEAQSQQKNHILKRIEEFVADDEKYLNIKQLLYGQSLSEVENASTSGDFEKKIFVLEDTIKQLNYEKQELHDNLTQVQKELESSSKKESLIIDLKTTVQEKDDMIKNLKDELNKNIEQVTILIEDNKSLSDKIIFKEQQAKGHADDVIKELGEQINSLKGELKTKSNQLTEHVASIQVKDDKITTLESCLSDQVATLSQLQNDIKKLSDALKLKEMECEEKVSTIKLHEEEIFTMNSQHKTINDDNEKKINLLEEEIKNKSNLLTAYLSSIEEKENLISSLQQNFDSHEASLMKLHAEKKELAESIKEKDADLNSKMDKIKNLEEQIATLTVHNETSIIETEKKMLDLVKEIERLTTCNQEKDENLLEVRNELNLSQSLIEKLKEDIKQLSEKVHQTETSLTNTKEDADKQISKLQDELNKVNQEKSDCEKKVLELIMEVEISMKCSQEKDDLLLKIQSELKSSQGAIESLTETVSQLNEKIQQADAKLAEINKETAEKNNLIQSDLNKKIQEKSECEQIIKDLSTEMEQIKSCLKDKEHQLLTTQKELTSSQGTIEALKHDIQQLSEKIQEADLNLSGATEESNERIKELHNELTEIKKEKSEQEKHIQAIQDELKKYEAVVENKSKDINEKNGEITALKTLVTEKDAQFDELSKLVETSQAQLAVLKTENEKNVAMLSSKELLINEFKIDLEKKEQHFREELCKSAEMMESKHQEKQLVQLEVTKLQQELEEKKKSMEILQNEFESARSNQKKSSDESSVAIEALNLKLANMEEKYTKLLEEKEKIAKQELKARDDKMNLEHIRDSLLQEKSVQEEIVKDREAKLEALQAEVNRMKREFTQHKMELEQKIDVSKLEIEAGIELKNQFEVQHAVIEELQQELQTAEEKCKKLETQLQIVPEITSDKTKLQTQVEELQKLNKERSEELLKVKESYRTLEEILENHKNLMTQKEKEVLVLKEQLQKIPNHKVSLENMVPSLKSLEEENANLRKEITTLQTEKNEKKPAQLTNTTKPERTPEEEQEMESLLSQVDFLNSIIVDMKQKNEELTRKLEAQSTCWEEEGDVNLNESKVIAPRLFCDICDVFDLHETCDCPKQESFQDEEIPQLRRAGTRQIEERPYCNNCEMFGHWTLDCEEPETF